MWESGDEFIFGNAPVFSEDGLLATHCVVPISEYGHFVVGRNSIYIFDGQQAHPIATNRVEDEFRRTLNTAKQDRMFVYPDYQNNEVWICYPSVDTVESYFSPSATTYCNRALVWNYRHNAWSFRDIPNLADMMAYAMPTGVLQWDETTEQWTTASGTWAQAAGLTNTLPTAIAKGFTAPEGVCNTSLVRFDADAYPTTKWNSPESLIERTGLTLQEMGFRPWTAKLLSRMAPKLFATGSSGSSVLVRAAVRQYMQGPWTISDQVVYDPAVNPWVNFRLIGQQIAYNITVSGETQMDLSQIDLEVEEIAER
jgi:hypothetical protein